MSKAHDTSESASALRGSQRSTGRVTLQDVAAAAGVSPITASRVVRGVGSVAPELAAKVKEAVERLGYLPDPAARALASSRGNQVVVLVPLLSNQVFVDLIEAIYRTLAPAGFQILIGVTHYDRAEEEQLLRSYLIHRPTGLLVTGFDRSEESRQLIRASGLPCVHLMETTDAPGVPNVGFSQLDAGAAITQHLITRGRKRIAFVAAQLDPRTLQRAEGYRRALRAAGLYDAQLEVLSPEPSSIALGARLLEETMRTRSGVDGVFFCNDDLAQGGLFAAHKLGIRVPERLSVVGFNDLAGSEMLLPPLTTVRTPRARVGEEGAQLLLQLMRGEAPARLCVKLDYEVMVRASS